VNHAISALTSVLQESLGVPLMASTLVSNFRKAVNTLRPTGPAAVTTWDINILLVFITKMGKNEVLSLEMLQLKVVLLLRLDLFSRTSDLTKLFRSEIVWEKNYFSCRFLRPKEWRPEGRNSIREWSTRVKVYKLLENVETCTYRTLKLWLAKTEFMVQSVVIDGQPCSIPRRGKLMLSVLRRLPRWQDMVSWN